MGVDKLIKVGFIQEAKYPTWVPKLNLIHKPRDEYRAFFNFTNLNAACPKNNFPLPYIDYLVDSTAKNELLSFMDAYSGYNKIPMFGPDMEHNAFITDRGLYCYQMMLFGLKNSRAT